mmetsp:Transcript_17393/g.33012  ORF Transcript_17393/g.33012 Transcript_17393/m.33012 type:complete len:208 (-) Transcript_17393:236-859(-)
MDDVPLRWPGVLRDGRRGLLARVDPDEAVLNGGRQSVPSVRHAFARVLSGARERPHRVKDLKSPGVPDLELRDELNRVPVLLQPRFKFEAALELLLSELPCGGHGADWGPTTLGLVLRDLREASLQLVQRLRRALHLLLNAVDHLIPLCSCQPDEVVLGEVQTPRVQELRSRLHPFRGVARAPYARAGNGVSLHVATTDARLESSGC